MDRLSMHNQIEGATFTFDPKSGIITVTIEDWIVRDPVRLARTAFDLATLPYDGWDWSEWSRDEDTLVFQGIPD